MLMQTVSFAESGMRDLCINNYVWHSVSDSKMQWHSVSDSKMQLQKRSVTESDKSSCLF